MTYTDQISYPNEVHTPSSDGETTLQKMKVLLKEGAQRSARIKNILRDAFTETTVEVKAGRTAMSPLAKEVTAETVAAVKENGQKVSETVSQVWQDTEDDDIDARIIRFIRSLTAIANDKLAPQVQPQVRKLDSLLNERYGDRYIQIKSQLSKLLSNYGTSQSAPTTVISTDEDNVSTVEVESEVVR